MSQAEPPRAVLDADIIYSRVLHELMGRVAKRLRLLDLVWSAQLLAEASRSLIEKKGLEKAVAERWVDYLPQNFPAGATDMKEGVAGVDLDALTEPDRVPRRPFLLVSNLRDIAQLDSLGNV